MEKSEQKQRPEHTPSASFKARIEPPPKTSGSTGVGGLTFMRLPRGGLVSIARNHFLVIYYLFGNILIYRKEESVMLRYTAPLILLFVSNIFMTYAWYGHLKYVGAKPLIVAILVSWGVAFFEYCFQVPANRIGHAVYSLPQLKIMQEVITMAIFAGFSFFVMKEKLSLNYLWASFCMVGAVFFIFRGN